MEKEFSQIYALKELQEVLEFIQPDNINESFTKIHQLGFDTRYKDIFYNQLYMHMIKRPGSYKDYLDLLEKITTAYQDYSGIKAPKDDILFSLMSFHSKKYVCHLLSFIGISDGNFLKPNKDEELIISIEEDSPQKLQELINDLLIEVGYCLKFMMPEDQSMTLIEYSAFLGSIKCFKFLMLNHADLNTSEMKDLALSGGNLEIIHILEQQGIGYNENDILTTILIQSPELFDWLIDRFPDQLNGETLDACVSNDFYHGIFKIKERREFEDLDLMNSSAVTLLVSSRNLEKIKFLLTFPGIDVNNRVDRTHESSGQGMFPLLKAAEKGYTEIVEFFLTCPGIKINQNAIGCF